MTSQIRPHNKPQTPIVSFEVLGTPKSQPRPRFCDGVVVSTVNPATKAWRSAVAAACHGARMALATDRGGAVGDIEAVLGKGRALRIEVVFYFGTKESERWGKPHTYKPDVDNVLKLIMDVMVNSGLLAGDDCAISCDHSRKRWCKPSGAGVVVAIFDDEEAGNIEGVSHVEAFELNPLWLTASADSQVFNPEFEA